MPQPVRSLALAVAGPATGAETPENAAQAAAESWLKVVDAGDYAASWDQAEAFFKGAVTKEQWTQAATGVRGPLGKLVSRNVKSRELKTSLPGAPDGKYVVVQFDTKFANKASAVETVTPMLDPSPTGCFRRRVGAAERRRSLSMRLRKQP